MRLAVEISKAQKNAIIGEKWNDTTFVNPVLNSEGKWILSKEEKDGNKNTALDFIKDLPEKSYKSINEAEDLSDVFTSDNIDDDDVDKVLDFLSEDNKLIRKDIRFRGLKWSNKSKKHRDKLIDKGFIFLESDLKGGTPEEGQEIVTPNTREDGVMEFGEKDNPNKQVWAAMYHPSQEEIVDGQITTTPANYIEGKLPDGFVGVGSEVSQEVLEEELTKRGKKIKK